MTNQRECTVQFKKSGDLRSLSTKDVGVPYGFTSTVPDSGPDGPAADAKADMVGPGATGNENNYIVAISDSEIIVEIKEGDSEHISVKMPNDHGFEPRLWGGPGSAQTMI
ncbi:hypothetical protein RhiJN_08938 [Ceratobasidium sp. AG-Ba]|nr:hypothetical protein RhiJN_08938 [Ceratobasidium sp. AG-Ba]QRW09726.1 hypothetical protein RhiLY_08725 [Ceratobasidium sp. AG-Ba]